MLSQFATDKNQRALLITKIDVEAKKEEEGDEALGKTDLELLEGDEIRFSL